MSCVCVILVLEMAEATGMGHMVTGMRGGVRIGCVNDYSLPEMIFQNV